MKPHMLPPELRPLTKRTLTKAIEELSEADADLAKVIEAHGSPGIWERVPGFVSVVKIILAQQVTAAAADSVFAKLQKAVVPFTPTRMLELDDDTLRGAGVSRQKLGYCKHLCATLESGDLVLENLATMNNEDVRTALTQVKGIGPWSADIYLLFVMKRPDVWPKGDLALAVALKELKRLRKMPSDSRYDALARAWRPWRSVAARVLWHYYVATRGKGK